MRQFLRTCLCPLLMLGCFLIAAPVKAAAHDPGKHSALTLYGDGGDVLRPERSEGGDYVWYIGFDVGLTYSRFQDGPVSWFMPNPYHVDNPESGLIIPLPFPLYATGEDGDGFGLYLGMTADFPVSSAFGIVLKGNYHNRTGSFSALTDLGEIHPDTETGLTTVLEHETDWTFNYYGFDLLLRIEPFDMPVYALIGPSFGFLSSNTAELNKRIVQPDDIYYTEYVNGQVDIVNEFRTASGEEEVAGFLDTRTDLKLGIGWRIALTPSLSLVPEAAVAVPLSSFVDRVHDLNTEPGVITEDAALFDWSDLYSGTIGEMNPDFNVITSFITIGLRWHIR